MSLEDLDPDRPLVLCVRVDEASIRVPYPTLAGSELRSCLGCGTSLWLSPVTLEEVPNPQTICTPCYAEVATPEDEFTVSQRTAAAAIAAVSELEQQERRH